MIRDDKRVAAPAKSARILLADDDFEMRRLLCWTLEQAGYAAIECPDGNTLLRKLDKRAPGYEPCDLIITDVRMPGVDGMQALHEGWLHGDWPPVILITAFPDPQLRDRARFLGARAILAKPFDMDSLLALVSRILPAQTLTGRPKLQLVPPPQLPFPLEVTCRHGELAAPLRDYIQSAASRLSPYADQIRDLSVVVEETRPGEPSKRLIRVSLKLRTATGTIAVKMDSDRAAAHANPYLTLHAAFATALHTLQRQLLRKSPGRPTAGALRRAAAAAGPPGLQEE